MTTPPPTMTVSPVIHSEGASAAPSEASPSKSIARAKPALEQAPAHFTRLYSVMGQGRRPGGVSP